MGLMELFAALGGAGRQDDFNTKEHHRQHPVVRGISSKKWLRVLLVIFDEDVALANVGVQLEHQTLHRHNT